jgi:toxin ParE1/3/4
MAKIIWTTQAWDELAEINDQLSKYSERYANLVIDRILDAANNLENFPNLGRKVPEANLMNLRELLIEKHRIIYFYQQKIEEIQVLTIRHSSRPLSDTILPLG